MACEDSLRAFYKLFYLRFYVSSDQRKKINRQFIQKQLLLQITNSSYKFSFNFVFIPFCSFIEAKTKNQVFSKLVFE